MKTQQFLKLNPVKKVLIAPDYEPSATKVAEIVYAIAKHMRNITFFSIIACLFTGCAMNMVTGRNQLSLVPESQLQTMAITEYKTFLTANKVLSSGNKDAAMIDRVGARIANAITRYYTGKGQGAVLEGYKWEFNTVDSKEVNAWCMPGGKVVVYTGLLAVTQNETALAIVIGHEIAHAVAKHGSERMSQGLVQQLGGVAMDWDCQSQKRWLKSWVVQFMLSLS